MLTLRNEYESFNRKADKKIAALKEVLDKMQRGEKVDVEKAFGTGDPEQEKEWEDSQLPGYLFRLFQIDLPKVHSYRKYQGR